MKNGDIKPSKILKLMPLLSHFLIWIIAIIVFWFFMGGDDAMGYSLLYLWLILPLTNLICSFFAAKNKYKNRNKLLIALLFGVMYMLAEYFTFKLANGITFHKINKPDFFMIPVGALISAVGMLIGSIAAAMRDKKVDLSITADRK